MTEAFYLPDGNDLIATELTRGPWDAGSQHAGPPAALLGRAIERLPDAADFHVGRVSIEILAPVPIGLMTTEARVIRPGRRVQLLEASLRADGKEVMRAAAWRLRITPVEVEPADPPPQAPRVGPEHGQEKDFFATGETVGYHTAMEYRFIEGGFLELGSAIVWMRMRQPLIAGEEPTPLQHVLTAADSRNGVSATLDLSRYLFINVDLTVYLERTPVDERVCLEAITLPQETGAGTADTLLSDRDGRIGRALQTLLIAERDPGSSTDGD